MKWECARLHLCRYVPNSLVPSQHAQLFLNSVSTTSQLLLNSFWSLLHGNVAPPYTLWLLVCFEAYAAQIAAP